MAHLDVLLAVGGELRPVRGDRCVQVEQAAFGKNQRGQARYGLRARPDVDDGVLAPRDGLGRIGVAAPDVEHRFTVDVDRDRGAHLCTAAEFFGQGVGDLVEPGVGMAVHDICHAVEPTQ